MQIVLKAPGTKRLTLHYDKLLSTFAFKSNLRRYAKDEEEAVRDFVYGEFGFMSLVAFFKKHRWGLADLPDDARRAKPLFAGVRWNPMTW